jgi:hypothetical protein
MEFQKKYKLRNRKVDASTPKDPRVDIPSLSHQGKRFSKEGYIK